MGDTSRRPTTPRNRRHCKQTLFSARRSSPDHPSVIPEVPVNVRNACRRRGAHRSGFRSKGTHESRDSSDRAREASKDVVSYPRRGASTERRFWGHSTRKAAAGAMAGKEITKRALKHMSVKSRDRRCTHPRRDDIQDIRRVEERGGRWYEVTLRIPVTPIM